MACLLVLLSQQNAGTCDVTAGMIHVQPDSMILAIISFKQSQSPRRQSSGYQLSLMERICRSGFKRGMKVEE